MSDPRIKLLEQALREIDAIAKRTQMPLVPKGDKLLLHHIRGIVRDALVHHPEHEELIPPAAPDDAEPLVKARRIA